MVVGRPAESRAAHAAGCPGDPGHDGYEADREGDVAVPVDAGRQGACRARARPARARGRARAAGLRCAARRARPTGPPRHRRRRSDGRPSRRRVPACRVVAGRRDESAPGKQLKIALDRHVPHAGRLDPLANGVVVLAARVVEPLGGCSGRIAVRDRQSTENSSAAARSNLTSSGVCDPLGRLGAVCSSAGRRGIALASMRERVDSSSMFE